MSRLVVVRTPIPASPYVELEVDGNSLIRLRFYANATQSNTTSLPCFEEAIAWLNHYFKAPKSPHHHYPVTGTSFQQRVWHLLQQIPAGEQCTYGELAKRLNSCARAVAGACRANPLPIFIPCHRVVAANGVGGYLGQSTGRPMEVKQWLLQHESHG